MLVDDTNGRVGSASAIGLAYKRIRGTMLCMRTFAASALALSLALPAVAQGLEKAPVTPNAVVAQAEDSEWVSIPADDLLVMELAPDAAGKPRTIVIQLMPEPLSQPWVENVRTLARNRWWDGKSVYRVADNWVTQWGDVSESVPLPEGVTTPEADYAVRFSNMVNTNVEARWTYQVEPRNPRFIEGQIMLNGPSPGQYDTFWQGWPVAGIIRPHDSLNWPIHCYAHVGVARNIEDTGSGAELYAVIGQAPRQLDRNVAVVGRVIEGIEHLSALPRGTGDGGVYEAREEETPILSVRLGIEIEPLSRPNFEYLDTKSESFARYVSIIANRNDPFYTVPSGGVDICNVRVPIRRVPAE